MIYFSPFSAVILEFIAGPFPRCGWILY